MFDDIFLWKILIATIFSIVLIVIIAVRFKPELKKNIVIGVAILITFLLLAAYIVPIFIVFACGSFTLATTCPDDGDDLVPTIAITVIVLFASLLGISFAVLKSQF